MPKTYGPLLSKYINNNNNKNEEENGVKIKN